MRLTEEEWERVCMKAGVIAGHSGGVRNLTEISRSMTVGMSLPTGGAAAAAAVPVPSHTLTVC